MRKAISLLHLVAFVSPSALAEDRLFDPPLELLGRISPSGSRLALVARADEGFQVDTLDLRTNQRETFFSTVSLGDGQYTVARMEWVDDDTVILGIVELTEGVAKLADTRNKKHHIVVDVEASSRGVRYIKTEGQVIDTLPDVEDEILFARAGTTSIVYRVDTSKLQPWGKPLGKTAKIDGGQFSQETRVTEIDGLVLSWMTASDGSVRAAFSINQHGAALMVRDGDDQEWLIEKEWAVEQKKSRKNAREQSEEAETDRFYFPVAIIDGTRDFVVLGDDRDGRESVFRYNYATGARELIYSHPTAEIVTAGLSPDHSVIVYASYFEDGVVKYHYVEGAYREVADDLRAIHPDYVPEVTATDLAENRFLVRLKSPVQPGRVLVYEKNTGRIEELYQVMPWLDEEALAGNTAGTVMSHDLEIEYFLTIPEASDSLPLVVYPHGGPWGVADSREFSPVVQYLAAQGFAVLQVNYRGSAGYGEHFVREGYGEFGNRMLDDIEAAISVASNNRRVDGGRICLIGESYGGYAAFMLAIRNPGQFRCVASFAGVMDLGLLLGSSDDESADLMLRILAGEASGEHASYEQLKALSPLYNAELLTIPVFISHGVDDTRVDIEHSQRMVTRLNQLDRPPVWLQLPGIGHGFPDARSTRDYYRQVASFLVSNLVIH